VTQEKQRAEIRKLVEAVQRAVARGKLSFGVELDRRIREQVKRQQEVEIER
jgi:hypothetical protein